MAPAAGGPPGRRDGGDALPAAEEGASGSSARFFVFAVLFYVSPRMLVLVLVLVLREHSWGPLREELGGEVRTRGATFWLLELETVFACGIRCCCLWHAGGKAWASCRCSAVL